MTDITWTNDTRRLSDLVPWEHNPKRMTKKQAEGLRLSIERFGFAVPFLVSPDGDIYDGHQRQALMGAIKEHGPNATVDVRVSSRPLTDDERRELVVRLKQNQAGWDFDMLANLYEREELLEWGFEPEELGMFADEPQGEDPGAQVDKADELREKWGVNTGDLWALGEHRLVCGDCTDAAVVARVMGGEKADTIITDPPYNVDKAAWDTDVLPMLGVAASVLPDFLTQDGICFWFTATRYIPEVIDATSALPYRWMFIWYPSNNMAHGDLGFQKFTAALVLGRERVWRKNMQDLREFPIRITKDDLGHPTPKPLELIEYLVSMASETIVFDGFLGSGTTLIACERLGRKCRAVEIDPGYVAVALQRFYDMTGIEPVLLEPGNSDLTVISNGQHQEP